jgi:glycosyltransferase involved in cell wall biosynthesis
MTSPNDKALIDPLISVVMIFRNTESFIGEAIESVLRQTYSNWEMLLVDDGSTDGSSAVAAEYAGRRAGQIHLLTHPNHENRGMSASRNAGAAMASGSFIAFLDSDDVWMENALETAVSIFRKHPIVGFTYGCALWWFSWTGDPADQQRDFRDTVASHGDGANKIVFPPQFVTTMMRAGSAVPCLTTVVVRKDLFEDVRGFEDDFPGLFEDQVFYTKLGMNAVGFRTDACWAKYRQHPDSSCSTAEKEGRMQAAGATFESWREAYLSGLGVNVTAIRHDIELPTQAVQAEIRISELEKARIWLERQWRNYKALSEEKDQSIAHLKAWIEELERGKRWLEKENARLQSGAERENVIAPTVSLPSTQESDDKPVVHPPCFPAFQ